MLPSRNHLAEYRWQPFFIAVVVTLVISLLMAAIQVGLNNGFGSGDVLPFLLWSLPFAAVIALIRDKLFDFLRRRRVTHRYLLAVLIGTASGVLWTYIVAIFLGAWFGAFSFSVLPCWIAGGAAAMIAGIGGHNSSARSLITELIIVGALGLISMTVPKYLVDFLSSNQELEVVSLKWRPGAEPLAFEDTEGGPIFDKPRLTRDAMTILNSLALRGHLAFTGRAIYGSGNPARVIIVMQRQVKEPVELLQPDGVTVIYVQDEDGWKMYPSDAPTLQRTIRVWPDENDPTWETRYLVENSDGSRQGGTLFTWPSFLDDTVAP